MQERKILTLNECLELNRPITLQEAVDLSLEDYTKYLYCKKIINYIPESLDKYVSEKNEDFMYRPEFDIILKLKGFNFDDDDDDDIELNEEEIVDDEIDPEIENCEPIYGFIYLNERKFNYIRVSNSIIIYEYFPIKNIINIIENGIFYGEDYV